MRPKILITGDRSMHPVVAVDVLAPVLARIAEQNPGITTGNLITGDLDGVERAARYLVPNIRTFTYPRDSEGHVLFEEAFEDLEEVVRVVILHTAPESSRILKNALNVFPPERIWLPLAEGATFSM
jgi:hypothetical protein